MCLTWAQGNGNIYHLFLRGVKVVVACGVDKQKLLIRKQGAQAVRYCRLLGNRRAKLTNFAPNSGTIASKMANRPEVQS